MELTGLLSAGVNYKVDYEARKFRIKEPNREVQRLYRSIGLKLDEVRFRKMLAEIHMEEVCNVFPQTYL